MYDIENSMEMLEYPELSRELKDELEKMQEEVFKKYCVGYISILGEHVS